MATRMQQRRGTATQWTNADPILNAGEIGWESDTNKFKIGDGTNHWSDLNYFVDGAELGNIIDGAPALLDTLNELAAAIGDDPNFITTVATNLSNHESDTTSVHGIANTADLATQSYVDTAVGNIDLSTKQDVVSGVSSTEIGYLDGVTSAIQTQLDAKLASADAVSTNTSNKVVKRDGSGNFSANNITAVEKFTVGSAGTVQDYGFLDGSMNIASNTGVSLQIQGGAGLGLGAIGGDLMLYVNSGYEVYINDSSVPGNEVATKSYVDTAVSDLIDSAPTALNTLNELAAALGDDANYASTITTALGTKAPLEDPTFTGTVDLSGATVVGLPAAGPTAVEIVMGVY